MNVLLIDDDETYHDLFNSSLKRLGHSYFGLYSGIGASKLVADEDIGIVALDIFMPDKEGLSTLTDLRVYNPTLPIYAISGDEFYLKLAEDLGACGSMQKPITFDGIQDLVDGKRRNCTDCRAKRQGHGQCSRQYPDNTR